MKSIGMFRRLSGKNGLIRRIGFFAVAPHRAYGTDVLE